MVVNDYLLLIGILCVYGERYGERERERERGRERERERKEGERGEREGEREGIPVSKQKRLIIQNNRAATSTAFMEHTIHSYTHSIVYMYMYL